MDSLTPRFPEMRAPQVRLRRRITLGLLRYIPSPLLERLIWCTQPKFVMAVAVMVVRQDRVLLLRHRYRRRHPLGLVTGFIEPGEPPRAAACREVQEETGVAVIGDRLRFIRMSFVSRHHLEVVYCLEADDSFPQFTPASLDGEIANGQWYTLDRLPSGISPAQLAIIEQIDRSRAEGFDPGRV